jgi:hypothetical protein
MATFPALFINYINNNNNNVNSGNNLGTSASLASTSSSSPAAPAATAGAGGGAATASAQNVEAPPSAQQQEGLFWHEPNPQLFELISNWRNYVLRQVSDIEFRLSRLFFCSAKILAQQQQLQEYTKEAQRFNQQQQQQLALSNGNISPASPSIGSAMNNNNNNPSSSTAKNTSGLLYVRCGCDRCLEDYELVVVRCDPFIARLLPPTAKQLQRLLKKLIYPRILSGTGGGGAHIVSALGGGI